MKVRDVTGVSREGRNRAHRPWASSLRHRCCFGYARLISQHPNVLCLVILVSITVTGLLAFLLYDLPDFSDPVAGFEPRGTAISRRSVTWQNMLDQTGAGQLLSVYPVYGSRHPYSQTKHPTVHSPNASVSSNKTTSTSLMLTAMPDNIRTSRAVDEIDAVTSDDDDDSSSSSGKWLDDGELLFEEGDVNEPFFCFNPSREYARMVFEPIHSGNLLTLHGLQSMCQLEEANVRQHLQFMRSCYTNEKGECCHSWSIGNYVAMLNNRSSCATITAADVAETLELLQKCSHFYRSRTLLPDCWKTRDFRPCPTNIHQDCIRYDAVYSIMHYLADVEFLSVKKPNNIRVQNAMVIFPVHAGNEMREVYEDNFQDKEVENLEVKVTELFFGLKSDLKIDVVTSGDDDDSNSSSGKLPDDGELPFGEGDANEPFFCFNPTREYARMVFEPIHSGNLLTLHGLQSMCQLEEANVRQHLQFMRSCYTNKKGECCHSWSIGNYVALLNNRSSCATITAADVAETLELLQKCSHFYRSRTLLPDCWKTRDLRPCPTNIHRDCIRYDAVYSIMHYLADVEFLSVEKPNNIRVQNAMVILPVHAGNDMREVYEDNFQDKEVENSEVKVTGLFFDLKYDLFSEHLTAEALYPCLGVVIIILLMWIYIGSLFITVMTVLSMAMSLILAYFLYRVVFRIPFFPFMNLTTVILLVGIGADDAFVYCDIWKRTRLDHVNTPHVLVVLDTLRHAAVSMFVTSLTTASAFFANTISSITSIKCFGIFAGTTILINCFFTVTWLPAVVTIYDHYFDGFSSHRKDTREYRTYKWKHLWCTRFMYYVHKIKYAVSEWSRIFFDKILPCVVVKLRYMWLLTLSTLTLGGFILIFLNPKLQLPTLPEFQLFRSLHPFERYDFIYKDMFWFEKVNSTGSQVYAHLPLTIVWGIKPRDNGNPLDPDNRGTITFDETFNIALPDSQQWLIKFCARLRNHTFYFPTSGLQFKNCFIESFKTWMQSRSCLDPETGESHKPCCQESTFPYSEDVFKKCLKKAVSALHHEFPVAFTKYTPGPRFSGPKDTIAAAIVEFDSTQTFTYSFEKIKTFWTRFEEWVNSEMKNAPPAMQNGWFTSFLDFYDLQDNLAHGTPIALGMSIIISTCVMFLTTQNLLISLYAILSISGTICVTIGALVLLGWQLNILESVILSVAVGLSVDFTVHYGVAYSIAPEKDRESRVVFSLGRMGSAITMAALTTFVAGALMMPSAILSYTQMGTFLMLIMSISWVFSTFYFQSLCRTIGPEGSMGQFLLPGSACCAQRKNTIRAVEDSEVIHSHSSEIPSSGESHELEPLGSFAASDLCSPAPTCSTSFPGACSKFSCHLQVAPHCPHHHHHHHHHQVSRHRPESPLVPVTSRAHSEVVWEGTSGFVTRLYQPVPQSEPSSSAILPNRNPNIPDIWVKM